MKIWRNLTLLAALSAAARGGSAKIVDRRKDVIIGALFALLAATLSGAEDSKVVVLTAEEFDANLSYRERAIRTRKVDPLAPEILVVEPDTEALVAPPVGVVIHFKPNTDSEIDLESLKIKYGWFDITKRVLEGMTVSPEGISGHIQSMREGSYKITVTVSDTLQRSNSARIEFTVGEAVAGET